MATTAVPADVALEPGLLVSIEGISGVGKTYLTHKLAEQLRATDPNSSAMILEEFSQRTADGHNLGHELLRALKHAAHPDPFLRGGHPASETLLLMAIKTHDYEIARAALQQGRLVLEGRSLHSTAVYQSLILHPADDDAAHRRARQILDQARQWRPGPALTILVRDDLATAIRRAEQRDATACTREHKQLHARADAVFAQLAADEPNRTRILDRRTGDAAQAISRMHAWIEDLRRERHDRRPSADAANAGPRVR
jgi:dTMP kinase